MSDLISTPDEERVQAIRERLATAWVVWSFEHDAWWGANHCGYTQALTCAGIYTEVEAKEIERNANANPRANSRRVRNVYEVAVPLAEALSCESAKHGASGNVAADILSVVAPADLDYLLRENDALRGMVRDAEDASGRVLIELGAARAALSEAETRIESLTKQLETRLGELFPLRRGADVLAARVNEMVDRGVLSARSPAADAMLDYAMTRYGQDRAIECVRNVSARLAVGAASAPSGESQPNE